MNASIDALRVGAEWPEIERAYNVEVARQGGKGVYITPGTGGLPNGKVIAGEAEPYQYLVESIRKFPRQADFARMIERAGFCRVGYTNYTGGIAALPSAWKI